MGRGQHPFRRGGAGARRARGGAPRDSRSAAAAGAPPSAALRGGGRAADASRHRFARRSDLAQVGADSTCCWSTASASSPRSTRRPTWHSWAEPRARRRPQSARARGARCARDHRTAYRERQGHRALLIDRGGAIEVGDSRSLAAALAGCSRTPPRGRGGALGAGIRRRAPGRRRASGRPHRSAWLIRAGGP